MGKEHIQSESITESFDVNESTTSQQQGVDSTSFNDEPPNSYTSEVIPKISKKEQLQKLERWNNESS